MRALIELLAGVAILTNGVIYGTDVFGALILRPAVASVDDRTLTQLLGHIHRIADRRLRNITIVGLLAAVATAASAAAGGRWVSTSAALVAVLASFAFIAIYNVVSKPVNAELTASALADRVPDGVRRLQARWDSVIDVRVLLQALIVATLCVAIAMS